MLIVCPSCSSRYNLPDDKIGPEGRHVRCSACASEWFVGAAAPGPVEKAADTSADGLAHADVQADLDEWAKEVARAAEADVGVAMEFTPTVGPDWTPPPAAAADDGDEPGAAMDVAAAADLMDQADGETPASADEPDEPGADQGQTDTAAKAAALAALASAQGRPKGWRRFLPFGGKTASVPPKTASAPAARRAAAAPRPVKIGPAKIGPVKRGRGKSGSGGLKGLFKPIAAAAVGCALIAGAIILRADIVRRAPSAAPVFAAIGLPVNVVGLSFSDVRSHLVAEADGRFLIVEGRVSNVDHDQVRVPPIEVRLRDAGQRTVYTWTTEPPRSTLRPGEALHFRTRLATPPESGRDVEVVFGQRARNAAAQR
jgi:predicted Zn finger-like uncharacterized protein